MASQPSKQVERHSLAEAMKRYLRRTEVSHVALERHWQREIARLLLRATRAAWSSHGTKMQSDLRIKKYVVHSSRSIFAPIPKVGTRSVEFIFASLVREREDIEARIDRLEAIRAEGLSSYRIFSLVRNPWSRVLSAYQDKVRNSHKLGNLAILSRHRGLRPSMTFAEFVEWLASEEGTDDHADRHWLSQHVILDAALGLPDDHRFIGRFESFEADFADIMKRMGLTVAHVPKRNVTVAAAGKELYRDFYTARTRSLVGERYARDIEIFGYKF